MPTAAASPTESRVPKTQAGSRFRTARPLARESPRLPTSLALGTRVQPVAKQPAPESVEAKRNRADITRPPTPMKAERKRLKRRRESFDLTSDGRGQCETRRKPVL